MKISCYQIILVVSIIFFSFISCKTSKHTTISDSKKNRTVYKEEFINLLDEDHLKNWEGDATYWQIQNGTIRGQVTPETLLKRNTFIIYKDTTPADFELKLEYKISENGNSGINYRSELIDNLPFALRGYQADIDGQNKYTGQNYEERKRTTLAYRGEKVNVEILRNSSAKDILEANIKNNAWQNRKVINTLGNSDELALKIKKNDWNEMHLIVKGNHLQHYVNGVLMSEVIDNDTLNRKFSGYIGVQVHVGPPMKVEFKNIKLKKI